MEVDDVTLNEFVTVQRDLAAREFKQMRSRVLINDKEALAGPWLVLFFVLFSYCDVCDCFLGILQLSCKFLNV